MCVCVWGLVFKNQVQDKSRKLGALQLSKFVCAQVMQVHVMMNWAESSPTAFWDPLMTSVVKQSRKATCWYVSRMSW